MRNTMLQLCLVVIGVTSVHAVKLLKTASLHARVFPIEGIERVWAVQGRDSLPMMGSEGDFYLTNVHPGRWQIRVDARAPYQDASFEIKDARPATTGDLGEIHLKAKS